MGDDDGWSAVATNKRSGAPIAKHERRIPRKGTIYITVGPQCGGKTTAVSQVLKDNGGVDVTIDDQALVYIKVPTDYFLRNATGYNGGITTKAYPPVTEPILGKCVGDRVKRLGQHISESDFSQLIRGSSNRTADIIVEAVEEMIRCNPSLRLPANVDLFVVESIFKPRPKEVITSLGLKWKYSSSQRCSISALDEATEEFKVHAMNERVHPPVSPLSWGNTNSRTREFQTPLQVAAQTGRPVEFIVFGGRDACDKIQNTDGQVVENCLPQVDLKTLIVRNLNR
ncbi:hypothetical protein THAOC_17182, partial [Thalassiosira oceanica]